MKAIPRTCWKWFGDPGHFICGQWCRFHLTTQVGKVLVSTLGRYVHPRHSAGSGKADGEYLAKNINGDEIGFCRTYETMVFVAGFTCRSELSGCGMPDTVRPGIDMRGYNDAGAATRGHLAMCRRWASAAKQKKAVKP